jgi:hypothetical protein
MVKYICKMCKRQRENWMTVVWCACRRFSGNKRYRDGSYVWYDLYAEPEEIEEANCRSRKCDLREEMAMSDA